MHGCGSGACIGTYMHSMWVCGLSCGWTYILHNISTIDTSNIIDL